MTAPNGWKQVTLADIASKERNAIVDGPFGSNLKLSDYVVDGVPVLQGKNITGNEFQWFDVRFISHEKANELKRSLVRVGDILIVKIGSIGYSARINDLKGYPHALIPANLCKVTPNSEIVDVHYLLHFLKSPQSVQFLVSNASATSQPALSLEKIKQLPVLLPPLPEQRRIAALLDKADHLRRTRRYAAQLSDTFLQAVFVRMFGDPRTNPMRWDVEQVGDQIDSIRYGTGSPPEYQNVGIPFIRATNIKRGTVQPEGMVFISQSDAAKISKCEVRKGNLIIVRSGVNAGDCAIVPDIYDGAFAAYDLVVEVSYPRNVYYNQLINSAYGKAIIEPMTRRAGQPHLNAEQIQDLHFPLPPLALQQKFARIVQQFERLRAQQREAERQAEHLFQTLLRRAFSGEE